MGLCVLPPELHDFRNYLYLAWKFLRLDEPDRLQYDLAWWLQNGPDRLCVLCWRGFGKSFILSTFNSWQLGMNADERVLNTSAAKKRADDTTRFILNMIRGLGPMRRLYPRDDQRSSTMEFDVNGAAPAHAPSCRSLGILSNMMQGSRASQIAADDIETSKNSQTPTMRQRIREATEELDGAIITPGNGHKVVFLGTPQIEESIYHTLPGRGFKTLIYPARYPLQEHMEMYGDRLAPILKKELADNPYLHGHPVEPKRFPEDVLQQRERTYRRQGWLLQFMLVPTLAHADKFPLCLRDLSVMDLQTDIGPERVVWTNDKSCAVDADELHCVGFTGDGYFRPLKVEGEHQPYQAGCMAIDPAGRGKDEIAWAVVKTLYGNAFLLDLEGSLKGYETENLEKIAFCAKKHDIRTIVVEQNWGGGMFTKLLQPVLQKIHPLCGIEEVRHYTMKEQRILDTLEPLFQAHRLIVDRGVMKRDYLSAQTRSGRGTQTYQFAFQATRMQREKDCCPHYDRIEAVAMACRYLVDQMSRNAEDEIQQRHDDEIDEELERFMDHVHGRSYNLMRGPARRDNWLMTNRTFGGRR